MPTSSRLARCRGLPVAALLAATAIAHAQGTPSRAERADPLDPQARVPVVTHRSSLAGYRRLGDDARIPWKEANEAVNRIGGWRAYAREAQQPDPPGAAPAGSGPSAPTPGTAPARGIPGGHPKH